MIRVGRFLTQVGASALSLAMTLAMLSAGGSGAGLASASDARSASQYLGTAVYGALRADDPGAGGLYLRGGRSDSVRRIPVGQEALPWSVHVAYSLDGPQTDAATIDGANGLVGVHVTVTRNELAAHDIAQAASALVPVVTFTIPAEVGDDLSTSDGTTVTTDGSNHVIAAVGDDRTLSADHDGALDGLLDAGGLDVTQSGTDDDTVLDLNVYVNATRFTMSTITLAAIPATDAASFATQTAQLSSDAATLADRMTGASDQHNDDLIAQLTELRDRERALADSAIAERSAAHKQAFDAYMAAYVGSYTTHLSGSISTKTQMTALIGTAGELTGDTPLAKAVVDLANAVNAVSAAHRHAGAADEVDAIIRRIRQQGVNGLADELEQEAGRESQLGSSGYTAGQSQLSQAMIPYSMAYTDTYTEHLSELTGGTSAGAAAYQEQAIAQTNASFTTDADLKADQASVGAAMAALATASAHTGKAQAIRQLLLRFEDRFEAGDTDVAANGESDGSAVAIGRSGLSGAIGKTEEPKIGVNGAGIAAVAEAARLKTLHAAREKAANKARQKAQSDGQESSLVDDQVSMSKDDVMSFAGGVASLGGGTKEKSSDSGAGSSSSAGEADGSDASDSSGDSGDTSTAGKTDDATTVDETPSIAFGFQGLYPASLLRPDASASLDETLLIGDASGTITAAAKALADGGSLGDLASRHDASADAAGTRFLLVYSTL